jgi:hypothetical protein
MAGLWIGFPMTALETFLAGTSFNSLYQATLLLAIMTCNKKAAPNWAVSSVKCL